MTNTQPWLEIENARKAVNALEEALNRIADERDRFRKDLEECHRIITADGGPNGVKGTTGLPMMCRDLLRDLSEARYYRAEAEKRLEEKK